MIDKEIIQSWVEEALELNISLKEIENFIQKAHNASKEEIIQVRKILALKIGKKKVEPKKEVSVLDEKIAEDIDRLLRDPEILVRISAHMDKKIVGDYVNRILVFLIGFSAYTHNPLNLFMKGPSSTGKTYLTVNIMKYFPKEDVWLLGGLSPKAIVHDFGKMEMFGEERRKVIDLKNKILVFLETPHPKTLQLLKPILSHDEQEIMFRVAEKSGEGTYRTMRVVIRNWPATIFCTTQTRMLEELSTRFLVSSPEISPKKIAGALDIIALDGEMPWLSSGGDPEYEMIRVAVQKMKDQVKIPCIPLFSKIKDLWIVETLRTPRVMRDFKKLKFLIETLTAFHSAQRTEVEIDGVGYSVASILDVLMGYIIYSEIKEETEKGVPKYVLEFFDKVVVPLAKKDTVITVENLVLAYRKVYKRPISEDTIRKDIMDALSDLGLVIKDTHPDDRRKTVYKVLETITPNSSENYKGKNRGNEVTPSIYDKIELIFAKEALNWLKKIPGVEVRAMYSRYDDIFYPDILSKLFPSVFKPKEEKLGSVSFTPSFTPGIYTPTLPQIFKRIDQVYFGKCAICGETTYIEWNMSGNHICRNCYVEESHKKKE